MNSVQNNIGAVEGLGMKQGGSFQKRSGIDLGVQKDSVRDLINADLNDNGTIRYTSISEQS